MSLIASVYDVRGRINMPFLRKEFYSLQKDPYIESGYRYKHIARFRRQSLDSKYKRLPHAPLFQSRTVNPTHGDINRVYPEIAPLEPLLIGQILTAFTECANVPPGETVLMQFQRVVCSSQMTGLPAVEGWHRDDVNKIGIICVDRHNVNGGITYVKESHSATDAEDTALNFELLPGYMVVLEDENVKHYVTPIKSADEKNIGWRDVVLLSYGGSSAATS